MQDRARHVVGVQYMFHRLGRRGNYNYHLSSTSKQCLHHPRGPHACSVSKSCLTLCNPMDCSPRGSSVHGIFSRQKHWNVLPFSFPEDLLNPGVEPASSALAGGFFTAWEAQEDHGCYYCYLSSQESKQAGRT